MPTHFDTSEASTAELIAAWIAEFVTSPRTITADMDGVTVALEVL